MLKNYIKIAFRNLFRQKRHAFINILGLTVGLTCSFFILLWVQDELRHDRFLEDGDRIYGVWRNVNVGGQIFTWNATSKPLAEVLEANYPAIIETVHSFGQEVVVTTGDQHFRERGSYVSEDFFNVFAFPFVQGNAETALQNESSIVITDRMARKLFGEDWQQQDDVLGQPLTIDHRKDFSVAGIIKDIPANSSFQADILLPSRDFFSRNSWVEQWGNNAFPLYVKLREGASPADVSGLIAGVVMEHEEGADETLFLKPYEDIYLYSNYEEGQLTGGRIDYVRIFTIVAIFLLFIACINFMNMATARSAKRAREIGIRKATGARQRSLIGQFLGESVLVALIAFVIALAIIQVLLPFFNDLTDKQITVAGFGGDLLLAGFMITLVVGLLAGSFPALYLSSFRPLVVLRGTFRQGPGIALLRKGLVVFQFALSVLLIVATTVVYMQMQYIRNMDLGLDQENVVYVAQEGVLKSQYDAVRQKLLQQPGISDVTAADTNPLLVRGSTGSADWDGKDPNEEYEISVISAGYDFPETMKMEIVAGRSFSREYGAENPGYLINEELAGILGDSDVVGKQFSIWDESGPVIGVVKNFDMNTIYRPIEPLVIRLAPEATGILYVRTMTGQTEEALAGLETVFKQFNPEYPFNYHFLDQEFEATYRSEIVMGTLANIFAGIAIFISCLGLFGLASFTAEQRMKEIGVRKVLGASVAGLVGLLNKDFLKLVLLGFVIAVPIAWYTMNQWLADFAYRIEITPGIFAIAGGAALLIALATVSWQSVKAALMNPVNSLRSE